MLELLRAQQREEQIDQHQHRQYEHHDRFHLDLPYLIRSQK
jgi:hypothetical protein